MEKKTIFLELPVETIEEIDRQNITGDRSLFVSSLINKQLHEKVDTKENNIKIFDETGNIVETFDIDTVDGFEKLAKKISDMTKDPVVKNRAKFWK